MAFFKINANEESVKDYTGGNYINTSGIYEVILKAVIVSASPNGSEALDFFLTYEGQDQMIFRAIPMTNNDGSDNVNQNLLTKLAIVCGASANGEISDPVSRMLPIGKGKEMKECMVLSNFDDIPLHLRIHYTYNKPEETIYENKDVRNFFRYGDKATASEIINNSEKGLQYEKELPHANKVKYNNGLTAEDIEAWKESNRSESKKEEPKKPAGGFGGKKFGNK